MDFISVENLAVLMVKRSNQKGESEMEHMTRRDLIKYGCLAGAFIFAPSAVFPADTKQSVPGMYPLTISVLKDAYKNEVDAHSSYVAFSRQAFKDDYPNISYLFTTFATSESIHADLFKKTLGDLGVGIEDEHDRQVEVLATRDNLRKAAKHELELIKIFYPKAIKKITPEKHENAVRYCRYSWQSHMQHKSHIEDVHRWSGIFFSKVAEAIEEEEMRYLVCRFCGSTEKEIPPKICPICRQSSTNYKLIERTAYIE
jgi:rubrerythrin